MYVGRRDPLVMYVGRRDPLVMYVGRRYPLAMYVGRRDPSLCMWVRCLVIGYAYRGVEWL